MMDTPIAILFVDDEEPYCRRMGELLTNHGFVVQTAFSGPEAISKVQANNGRFHVAVIDQRMGPPNGTEIMVKLRQEYPSVQVIILTGIGDGELGKKAMEHGAFRYIVKQTDLQELVLNIGLAARFGFEQRRGHILEALVSAGQRIGAAQNEEELYEQIYSEALKLLPGLDGFLISYYDKQNREVSFPFAYKGGHRIEVSPRPNGNSITEYVLRNQKPLLLPNGDSDFRKEYGLNSPDPNVGYVTSEIAVPMFMGDQIYGTINVLTYDSNIHFTEEQLEVLQSFANQAVAAIEVTQKLVEAKQLSEAALMLAGKRGKKDVLSAIVEGAHYLIGSNYTGLIMQDEDGFLHKVRPVIPDSFFDDFDEPRQHGGITRSVVDSREARIIPNTNADSMVKKSVLAFGIQSMLALPLIHGDRVLGVLFSHTYKHRSFNSHDVALWTAFASQAAATLDSAIEEEKQIKDYMKLTNEVSAFDETLSLEEMLNQVVTTAQSIFEADECRLGYIDPPTGQIAKWISPEEYPPKYNYEDRPRSNGITNHIIRTREPVFWTEEDSLTILQPHPEIISRGLKSLASLPLLHNGRCIGVLHCYFFTKKRSFNEHIKTMMELFCARAAMALGRSHRDYLSSIWRDLDHQVASCTNLEDLYGLFLDHANKALRADFSIFYPFDPTTIIDNPKPIDDKTLYTRTLQTPWQKPTGALGGGVVDQLLRNPESVLIINDLESLDGKFTSHLAQRESIKSFVALRLDVSIPVGNCHQLAGFLFLNYRCCTTIEKSDLVELLSAASLIAAGILRLNLQSALQKAAQQRIDLLRAVVEIFQAFENKNEGISLDVIAEKARKALLIDICTLLEYDWEERRFTGRGASGMHFPNLHYTVPPEFASKYMERSQPTEIMNIQNDELMRSSDFVTREKIKSAYICPLRLDDTPLGLLFASYRELKSLSSEEREAVDLFAHLAALVLREMQMGTELSEVRQKLNRRLFLTWVSMVEGTWRHSIVQQATSIWNYSLLLQRQINMLPNAADIEKLMLPSFKEIDRLSKEIAAAPPRVPQSWEMAPEFIPIAALLREVGERELHHGALETTPLHSLKLDVEQLGAVQIKGYRRWLIYLLEVLIQNSLAAMPKGGTVVISGRAQDHWAEIRIQDTGWGIPEKIQNSLFKELVTKDQPLLGMGIGGLLAATLVEEHGGTIQVERPGPGDTTVLIRLPISE
ncbi:MAG TPA: GAF domain-containing protein [Anaerolineales bacterium]|nr:GAF domain-containing protein [Anaerolineales bacterium]